MQPHRGLNRPLPQARASAVNHGDNANDAGSDAASKNISDTRDDANNTRDNADYDTNDDDTDDAKTYDRELLEITKVIFALSSRNIFQKMFFFEIYFKCISSFFTEIFFPFF